MLSQEVLKRLATLAKVKVEDLKAAIDDPAEKAVEIDTAVISFTEQELTTLKTNEYNNGKVKGPEMLIKEAKEKLGLDFNGKTIDNLLEAYSKKVLADAKVEPEKQVKELQDKLALVQNTAKDFETKYQEKEKEVARIKDISEIGKFIPAFGDNAPALGQEEVLSLMKANGYDYKRNDAGKLIFTKNGTEVMDHLSQPLEPSAVINTFLKEKKIIIDAPAPGGRGGGDHTPPAAFTKLSDIKKHFTEQGKSMMGEEFSKEVEKAVAANKDFKMDL